MMNNKDNGIAMMMNNDDEESNNISKPNKKFQDSEEEEEEEDAKILDDDDDDNLVLSKSFNESTTKHDSSYLEGSSSDVGGDDDNEDVDGQAPNGNLCGYKIRLIIFGIAFVLGFVLCFVKIDGDGQITQTAAIAIWMAALWLTELIPLVVTAFFPLVLFPMFGIVSSKTIAASYMSNTIFLFIAGMLLALTLERWDLHRRFSYKVLSWCGAQPSKILMGMMGSTFFLSMFVSNTATALMMVPNAISVCKSLEQQAQPEHRRESKLFGTAVMLGIAYSANVGGMASLIGTPPNLVFQAQMEILFPEAPEITFAQWLAFGLPLGFVILVITWVYLRFMYLRNFKGEVADRQLFIDQYTALGVWSKEQIIVGTGFVLLALLWIFRADLEFSSFTIKGWSNIFPEPSYISDATIGMAFAIFMFLCPARPSKLPDAPVDADTAHKTTLLNWSTANKMPYDIIFLFGGGFALAKGFVESGLSAYLGDILGGMNVALAAQVFIITFVIIWLTELTSNTATSNIMIPIAASIAVGAAVSPYTFMIPTTLACSCAFCLPVATPPNMVVFSSGKLKMMEMIRAGVFLNIISSVLILLWTFTLVPAILDVDADELPEWAEPI